MCKGPGAGMSWLHSGDREGGCGRSNMNKEESGRGGEGGRAHCGGPSRSLESGLNLRYNGKPLEDSGRM